MTGGIKRESASAIIKDTADCFAKFEDDEAQKKHLPV